MNDGCVPAKSASIPANWPVGRSFVFGQADLVVSTVTLSSKVRPEAKAWLDQAAREVNQVWNYCNATSEKAWRTFAGKGKWLSAFDMNNLMAGCGEGFERIGIDTAQAVAAQHANSRNQFKKSKLAWRKSGGPKRSLGWIPFKPDNLRFSAKMASGKAVTLANDPKPKVPAWPTKKDGEDKAAYALRKKAFAPMRESAERELDAWEYRRIQAAHAIKVSFLGKSIRLFNASRLLEAYRLAKQGVGALRSGNFSQDAVGDWYLNVVIDRVELPLAPLNGADSSVGIDPGQISAMTASDGAVLRSRRYRDQEPKLQQSQQRGHKKQTKRLHRTVRRQRKDDQNKFSRSVVDHYARIWVGDLDPKKLARSKLRGQAKSIQDAAIGAAFATVKSMGHRAGRVVEQVDERYSTRRCSACIRLSGPSGLESCVVRQWTCVACNARHDRDINSGENIRHTGELGWQTRSPVERVHPAAPRYWRPFAGTR